MRGVTSYVVAIEEVRIIGLGRVPTSWNFWKPCAVIECLHLVLFGGCTGQRRPGFVRSDHGADHKRDVLEYAWLLGIAFCIVVFLICVFAHKISRALELSTG